MSEAYFQGQWISRPGPEVIKLFPCSTQLSTKFILLINVKMPTIVGILTLISMINTTSDGLKARNLFIRLYFCFYEQLKFCAQLSWAWKRFYNLRASFAMEANTMSPDQTAPHWGNSNDYSQWTIPFEPVHEFSNKVACATSKASDQPAHMPSLIRAFASR